MIELLVVIGIIAILAAMLLPSLTRAKAQANSARCKSNLHQMGLALQMYVADYKSYPFYVWEGYPGDRSSVNIWWEQALEPYYPLRWTNRAYHCPGYKRDISAPRDRSDLSGYYGSYAYNGFGVGAGSLLGLGEWSGFSPRAIGESTVSVPVDMLAIGESRVYLPQAGNSVAGIVNDFMLCWYADSVWAYPPRHGSMYNSLFCDAHVAALAARTVFNPTNTASMWNNDHKPHPEFWHP